MVQPILSLNDVQVSPDSLPQQPSDASNVIFLINFRNHRDMYPPFGIMYVADALEQVGFTCRVFHETAEFSGGSLFTAEQIAQSGGELVDDDEELDAIDDQESEETEHIEEEQNELAALFQDDIIIDPYVQALRDNLPAITIDQLLTNIRSVSSELREKINAEHVAQG